MADRAHSTASDSPANERAERAEVPLDRDIFMRSLVRHLAATLEDVVGLEEAKGYISVVGGSIGEAIDRDTGPR